MHTIIEDIITRELRAICSRCKHQENCVYQLTARKAIIQCELFELNPDFATDSKNGLCKTCDHSGHCTLRGRTYGVWQCNEFM